VPCAHDGVTPSLSEQEIESFITAFNRALPGANVRAAEIVATDVGILPMVKDSPRGPLLVSNERIHTAGLYAVVISTKYTTFRAQGRKVLRALS